MTAAEVVDFRARAHPVEPNRPFIAGQCFDDLWQFSGEQRAFLAGRGVVWLTEFSYGGRDYGGTIIAPYALKAARLAAERGFGEKIIGVLCEEIAG